MNEAPEQSKSHDPVAPEATRTPSPPRRRVVNVILITIYTVVLLVAVNAGIILTVFLAGFEQDIERLGEQIGHEVFAISMFVGTFLVAYLAARRMITRHRRATLLSTLGLTLLVLGAWASWAAYGRWRVAQETEKWIALGGWIDEPPPVRSTLSPDRNAATFYRGARGLIAEDDRPPWIDRDGSIMVYETVADDDGTTHARPRLIEDAELAEVLGRYELTTEAGFGAASVPEIEWPAGHDDSLLGPFRSVMGLLQLDAEVRARLGQREQLNRHVRALLAMNRHAQREPTIFRYLAGLAAIDMAISTIERIGPHDVVDPKKLLAELEAIDARLLLADAVIYDASWWSAHYRFHPTGGTRDDYMVPLRLGLLHLDLAAWLRSSRETVTALRNGASYAARTPGAAVSPRWYLPLTSGREVVGASGWELNGRLQRRVHLARAALQILLHRRDHGDYPDSLVVIGEDVPIDPVLKQPFTYEKIGRAFRLYSPTSGLVEELVWDWSGEEPSADASAEEEAGEVPGRLMSRGYNDAFPRRTGQERGVVSIRGRQ